MTTEAVSSPQYSASLSVRIWRGGAEGAFVDYDVPMQANQTVLDIVTWVQRHAVADMAPFFETWQRAGESLFEKTNREISANLSKVYEGTRPATLRRYGETDDRSDEVV